MTAGRHPPRDALPGTVEPDAGAVFRAAIGAGLLSETPTDDNRAGRYFYMFHDGTGAAWFKHRDTRRHVTLAACRAGGPA